MISIIIRKTSDSEISNLSVYIKNRVLNINTYISMKMKIKTKEWSVDMQLPKKFTDERPINELDGMSYAELTQKIMRIKKELSSAEECQKLTTKDAKSIINSIINEEYIKEAERIEEEKVAIQRKKEAEASRMTLREWIAEFIRQCEDGERLKRRSTRRITPGTIKSYKGTLAQLDAYMEWAHKIIDFDDVTIDFYDNWKRFFIKKQYSPNTVGRHVKNLKSFLFAAEDMKLTTRQDYKSERFSVDHEDVDNVYLTEERIQQMCDFNPMDEHQVAACIARLPEKDRKRLKELTDRWQSRNALSECKDVFIVGCLTGQRVSDYKRINSNMIVQLKDKKDYITLRQEKTGKIVYIPLDDRVTAILNKYGGKLPKVFDQKINMHIKTVGHLLGWTEKANITELHGTMAIDKGKKFYECIKTHTARRTFATNWYKKGVALSSIMAITGHGSEAMLRKYLKLDNKERAMLAALDFEKVRKAQ